MAFVSLFLYFSISLIRKVKMKIILLALLLTSLAAPAAAQSACSICPGGAGEIGDPDYPALGQTCGELDLLAVATGDQGLDCDTFVASLNTNIDSSAICCDDVVFPLTCDLCSGGTIGDPLFVPEFGTFTCEQYAVQADATINSDMCDDLQTGVALFCCDDIPGVDRCSLCPEGSTLGSPGLELPFDGGGEFVTCEDIDNTLSFIPRDDESCIEVQSNFNEIIDFQAFCGCSGVELPGICSFCGPDDLVIDPEKLIVFDDDDNFDDDNVDDDDAIDFDPTCGTINLLAPFLTDEVACSDITDLIPLCCEPASATDELSSKEGKKGKKGNSASSEGKKGKKNGAANGGKKGKKR